MTLLARITPYEASRRIAALIGPVDDPWDPSEWIKAAAQSWETGRFSDGERSLYLFVRDVWNHTGNAAIYDLTRIDDERRAAVLAVFIELWVGIPAGKDN